jgi:hypothetical protein
MPPARNHCKNNLDARTQSAVSKKSCLRHGEFLPLNGAAKVMSDCEAAAKLI